MDQQGIEEEYHPSFEQILNINDYEQEENPPQEQPLDNEQLSLEEIEHILSQQGPLSKVQMILVQKINHMQNRLDSLSLNNHFMSKQIKDLEDDLHAYDKVQINQAIAHQFLDIVERELAQYRQQFNNYRNKQMEWCAAKDDECERLREIMAQLSNQKDFIIDEKEKLLQTNEQMVKMNQNLVQELENMQNQVMESRAQSYNSKTTRYTNRKVKRFDGEVQAELQTLIQKLIEELDAQRMQKRTLNNEMRTMQQEIMDMERQISAKNNKIYSLEINNLKINRSPPKNGRLAVDRLQDNILKNTQPKVNSYHKQNKSFSMKKDKLQAFALMELLNEDFQINQQERLIIASKIIDYYLRKISAKDYNTHMLENLIICNFNHTNPQLCFIRKLQSTVMQEGQLSQERLIWNLGFILDNLINQSRVERGDRGQAQSQLSQVINNIMEECEYSLKEVYQMKGLVDQALKVRI